MLSRKKLSYLSIYLSLAGALSSCGGQAYQNPTQTGLSQILTPSNSVSSTGSGGQSSSSTDTSTTDTSTSLPTPIVRSFRLQEKATTSSVCGTPTPSGVNVGSFTVSNISTDNLMKVTIKASAPSALPCSTLTTAYSCVQLRVTVGTREEEVMVSYGSPSAGPCSGKPNSVTLDFSDQATRGHGLLSVKVEAPQMDNCHAYSSYQYGYALVQGTLVKSWYNTGSTYIAPGDGIKYSGCPMAIAYDNYIVAGSLSIQTNTP